jgi:ADP-ribosylglycohydrolase
MALDKDNVRGLMIGCGVGDTLGMPVEGMDMRQIKRAYGQVTTLQNHPRFDKLAGSWTDDTQLTWVVMESLWKCGCFNIDDLAIRHMEAYTKREGRGWGSATMTGVNRMVRGFAPQDSGKLGSAGDGTAMKAAPLGVYAHLSGEGIEFLKDVIPLFTMMTHRDVRAVCGAGIQALCAMMVCQALEKDEFLDGEEVLEEAIALSREFEAGYGEIVMEWFFSDGDEKDLAAKVGSGFYVNEAQPFSMGVFLKYGKNFRDALIRTVNVGGDTDTNGAMVGSLSGLFVGVSGIPEDWSEKLEDYKDLVECADKFWKNVHE